MDQLLSWKGVARTAEGAVDTAQRLARLIQEDREKVQQMGRSSSSILRVHEALKEHPITSITDVSESTRLSFPTVSAAMGRLADIGIVREVTEGRRNRMFAYAGYVNILSEGTEPL